MGFLFLSQKYCRLQQCGVKYNSAGLNSGGFTNCLSLQCRTSNRDFLGEKSKSPVFPVGGGEVWLQLTSALYFQGSLHTAAEVKKWLPSIKRDIDFYLKVTFFSRFFFFLESAPLLL